LHRGHRLYRQPAGGYPTPWPTDLERSTNEHVALGPVLIAPGHRLPSPGTRCKDPYDSWISRRLFGSVYLGTESSPAISDGTRRGIWCALSDGSVHVAGVCMIFRFYNKTLVPGPNTRNALARSQSRIHPRLTGRRWVRVTCRTHGHRRAAHKTSLYAEDPDFASPFANPTGSYSSKEGRLFKNNMLCVLRGPLHDSTLNYHHNAAMSGHRRFVKTLSSI
jgi:hypothetical protein